MLEEAGRHPGDEHHQQTSCANARCVSHDAAGQDAALRRGRDTRLDRHEQSGALAQT